MNTPTRSAEDAPAATDVERALTQLWASALGIAEIGLDEDFFALGGSSIQAFEVAAALSDRLGVELPVDVLFSVPTIRQAAQAVIGADAAAVRRPALDPGADLRASASQERIWFAEQWRPGTATYHMPWAVDIRGALDRGALLRALDLLVSRHEILRTAFPTRDGRPNPVVRTEPWLPVAEHDLGRVAPGSRAQLAETTLADQARRPFDLEHGPLVRADLLRLSAREHILLLTMHHLVGDAWSTRALLAEVTEAYTAYASGGEPALPEPPMPFGAFAAQQRSAVEDGTFADSVAYWADALAGVPPDPVTVAPSGHSGSGGHVVGFELTDELSSGIRELGRQLAATPFTVLATAVAALLNARTGREDVVLGTTAANRERADIAPIIGPVFNLLPLRFRVPADATFAALVARAKPAVLGAFAHQEVPFDVLVRRLAPDRELNALPFFRVLFELSPEPEPVTAAGLSWRPRLVDTGTAKYDLAVTITESGTRFRGALTYDCGRYDAADAERFAGDLLDTLEHACADPHRERPAAGRPEPAAEALDEAAGDADAEPDHLERLLIRLWADLLQREPAGIATGESFFALAGTSLEIARLVAWLRSEMRVPVNPLQIYQRPTVAALAAAVLAAEPEPGYAHHLARVLLRLRETGSDRWHPIVPGTSA
ncbi:condensation domain-containing protein [Amycolatopsis kentuckyensis]|uniref:condensation domain-containing protein n=1 Tax=Amycolatopsis kentuckyensis TaxID=218823 RepID=UPI000A3D43BF|nr:condensation domain-containing protein [Amycolatopsis kentuckyensis]